MSKISDMIIGCALVKEMGQRKFNGFGLLGLHQALQQNDLVAKTGLSIVQDAMGNTHYVDPKLLSGQHPPAPEKVDNTPSTTLEDGRVVYQPDKAMEARIAKLEGRVNHVDTTLKRIETRARESYRDMNQGFAKLEKLFNKPPEPPPDERVRTKSGALDKRYNQ